MTFILVTHNDEVYTFKGDPCRCPRCGLEWQAVIFNCSKELITQYCPFCGEPHPEDPLLRSFPPFSSPAPYSHEQEEGWDEWQNFYSCVQCPHLGIIWKNRRPHRECLLGAWQVRSMHKCRFTAYRHVLFRRHDDVMGGNNVGKETNLIR